MTLQEKDKALIWHPFTQEKTASPVLPIVKGEGASLFTADGKTFIDGIASWWVNLHGHSHPYIAEKIALQARTLEHVLFAGFTHPPAIELAERLLDLLPDTFSKVFYSDNGSTSVEVALKMALQYWYNQGERKKTKILALENSYHGDTFGAMAVGSRSTFTAPFDPLLFEVEHLPVPRAENLQSTIERIHLLAEKGEVAAFIFEPLVQGAAGMIMYEPEHLEQMLQVCKEHQILCIADEVMTGFGRTGRIFAIDYLKTCIDIICLSKGLTGGFLPLGVTACTKEVYNAFYADETQKTFFHGHSYTANPLSCAAAIASMDLLQTANCQEQIKSIAQAHSSFMTAIKGHKRIKNIRQRGTILAIEIDTGEITSYFNSRRNEIYSFCINKGVLLRPLGNVIYCMPPYCIKEEELISIYSVIKQLLDNLSIK